MSQSTTTTLTNHPEVKEIENCAICQDELKTNIHTLRCSHQFHDECIQKWIDLRNLCPLCNQKIDPNQPVRQLENDDLSLTAQAIGQLLQNELLVSPSSSDFITWHLVSPSLRIANTVRIANVLRDPVQINRRRIRISEGVLSNQWRSAIPLFGNSTFASPSSAPCQLCGISYSSSDMITCDICSQRVCCDDCYSEHIYHQH